MSTYAIGDVQGCHRELMTLLEVVDFDRGRDQLWFVGDLVNRGPDSVSVLRYVRDLAERAVVVLGNHDLHLIATAAGVRAGRPKDTFGDVLDAPDRDELLGWLAERPLMHHDPQLGFSMVHAGIAPPWSATRAATLAREIESMLRGPARVDLLANMYGNQPDQWSDALQGWDRTRFIINAFTRMRYLTAADARLNFRETGPPGSQPAELIPWFELDERASRETRIVFGHWATLEIERPVQVAHGVFPLDTGCVWGRRLTAMRLEDRRYTSVNAVRA